MERDRTEPLFNTVNAEMARTLEEWHDSPYSSESAGKINTLIQLARSSGYIITLEINRKSWEDKNAAELSPDFRNWIDGNVVIVEIDPPERTNKGKINLLAHAYNPTDEYMASGASFSIRCGDKDVFFSPDEILGLQITEERTFRTLKEVKDAYRPGLSDEEFLQMMDTGEIPESWERIVEKTRKANEPESEPE